jgi:hypothetical protein
VLLVTHHGYGEEEGVNVITVRGWTGIPGSSKNLGPSRKKVVVFGAPGISVKVRVMSQFRRSHSRKN